MERAILIEPENWSMRYNFACSLANAGDKNLALEMLEPVFANAPAGLIQHSKSDPDLEHVRKDSRFAVMLAVAEARPVGKSGAV